MCEQAKAEPSCGKSGVAGGVPLRKWWQSSRLFNQDVGLPPFLEPGDPRWMDVDRLQRSLAAFSWLGCIPAPMFVPYISGSMHQPGQKISKWRVSLEVAHFSPAEISVGVRDGFLQVGGKHEERPDEHGFIARCFTRKYRLPAEVDETQIVATLSGDGVLTVEAPVSETSVPAAVIIPIKVELEAMGEKQEKEEVPDADSCRAPEGQFFPSAEDDEEEESRGDQVHPGGTTAGPQQHEERREYREETHEKPAGESRLEDGDSIESIQEIQENQSKQPEDKESAVDGEIQVVAGSGEAAEEITHPGEPELGKSPSSDVPSQQLEASDIKQEHAE